VLHVKLSDDSQARIRSTPETEALGLAGLVGPVFGHTQPSSSGVAVIGEVADDYAIAVHLQARGETLWFAPELLERVGPPPKPRGAWAVNEPRQRENTPVTTFLDWLGKFLPQSGKGKQG
jgi:hypothetical protein